MGLKKYYKENIIMFSQLSTSFFVGSSLDIVMAVLGIVCIWILYKEKIAEIKEQTEKNR